MAYICFYMDSSAPEFKSGAMGMEAMRKIEPVMRVRIYLSESDKYRERPLYEEIVVQAQQSRLAGATVFRGYLGYSKPSGLDMRKFLHNSKDIPVVIEILDSKDKINAFFGILEQLLTSGVTTVETVRLQRHSVRLAKSA
jgi:uncharacterized protein